MNTVEKKVLEEYHRSFLLLDTRILTDDSRQLDSDLTQLRLQSTNLDFIESIDCDVYILWLTNDDQKEVEVINGLNIRIFHSNYDLIEFISEIQLSNIFLIINYEFVENILSILDDFSQIVYVYILANEQISDNPVVTDSKRSIRQISNDKNEIFRLIIEDIDVCTQHLISSTIFDLNIEEESTNQNRDRTFIWYYLLIESLFDLNAYNATAKTDFIEYCRQVTDLSQQAKITEFENEYQSENAIRWYTRDSFIYRQLNKALRIRDIDVIFKFRFFIIDFQKQLEQYYDEEALDSLEIVYRGQELSQLELIKLKNNIGKNVSFNTYMSASIDREIALIFATGVISVLFEIEVNSSIYLKNKRIRPVYIGDKSQFPDECEVIFPIGSTFLVNSVEMEDNQWNIKLKIIDVDDYHQKINLVNTTHLKQTPSKLKFAGLLILLGDYEKAERYIQILIEDLELSADLTNLGYAYGFLGEARYGNGDYQYVLPYFEKALNYLETDNIYRSTIYRHLANFSCEEGDYVTALDYLNQALKYKQTIELLDLASLYSTFGRVYKEMDDFDNALIYLNQALDIYQSNSSIHHNCSMTYFYLGLIYQTKSDNIRAFEYLKRALDISLDILPKNHQMLILFYAIIGFHYSEKDNFSEAFIYFQKAFDLFKINEQNQNFNAIMYIFVCNLFVSFYERKRDKTNSFYYTNKAYKVYIQYQNSIPKNSHVIRTLYINLSKIYQHRYDYTSSLDYLFKALNISRDKNNQIVITTRVGKFYLDQGDINMALHYLNKSLELIFKTNRSDINDNSVFWIYLYMSDTYQHKNDFEKSILFAEKALQLQLNKTNKEFLNIVLCYSQLMILRPEQSENYIKEIIHILQEQISPISSKLLSYTIIGFYYHKQKDFPNALKYYHLSLDYQLKCFPPCYPQLAYTYWITGEMYKMMDGEDSNEALVYFEKSRDIYIELSNMKKIPIDDRQQILFEEEYIIENIDQNSKWLCTIILLVHYSIARYYAIQGNYEQALNNIQIIERILNKYQDKKELIKQNTWYSLTAYLYKSIQYYDQAIFYSEKQFACISNDYNEYGDALSSIAMFYRDKQDYLMAISKCKIALTFLHNSKSIDHEKLGLCYLTASQCFAKIGNGNYGFIYAEQAIQHFSLCIPIKYDSIISSYISGVLSLQRSKPWDYSESLQYILTALKFIYYNLSNSSLEMLYRVIGLSYFLNTDYSNAALNYKKSLEYSKTSDDISSSYSTLSFFYVSNGELDKAYEIIKENLDYQLNLENINFLNLSDLYIDMGSFYENFGNYKLATLSYQSAYDILEKYQNDRIHENYGYIYIYFSRIHLKYGQVMNALKFCLKARRIVNMNKMSRKVLESLTYINLGLIECQLKNYYKSLEYFESAWELAFNDNIRNPVLFRRLYRHISYVYFKIGQTEIAMNNYLKCLSLYNNSNTHPELAQIYKNIGLIYEQNEKTFLLALSYYNRALEALPNNKHPDSILYKSLIITLENKITHYQTD